MKSVNTTRLVNVKCRYKKTADMGIQKSVKHLKTLATRKEDAEKRIVKEDCT